MNTAQTPHRFLATQDIPAENVRLQLRAVLDSLPIKAAKTGMLYSAGIVEAVAGELSSRPEIAQVIDPVLRATAEGELLKNDALMEMIDSLFPLASLITPNIPEAENSVK